MLQINGNEIFLSCFTNCSETTIFSSSQRFLLSTRLQVTIYWKKFSTKGKVIAEVEPYYEAKGVAYYTHMILKSWENAINGVMILMVPISISKCKKLFLLKISDALGVT